MKKIIYFVFSILIFEFNQISLASLTKNTKLTQETEKIIIKINKENKNSERSKIFLFSERMSLYQAERKYKLEKLSNDILNYLISQLRISKFDNKKINLKVEIVETRDFQKINEENLEIEEWNNINAWFGYPDRIFIGENLFKLFDNEAELAAILCHELGHVYYDDIFSGFDLEIELKADFFALRCLKKANYNIESLKFIFEKLFKIFLKGYPTLEKLFLKRIEEIDLYINESKNDGKLFILFKEEEFKDIINPAN